MADFEANFTLDPQPEIEADFNIEVGGITEHNLLSNRDLPDQHPISAITGLQEALDTIPDDYVSEAELEAALLEKQDVIRDLSEIRQGATLGATAVQPSELESYATKGYVDDGLSGKQDALTAGANIQIIGNTISATDTTYTAGTGIDITNGVISNTQTSAEWGNIQGNISAQTDLQDALDNKANISDIPTKTSDLTNDSGFITISALTPYATQTWVEAKGYITNAALVGYATESWVTNQNYITGDYVGNATLTIQKNSTTVDTFTANATVDKIINIIVPTVASDVDALPDTTKYGASLSLTINSSTYVITAQLKDQNGDNLGTAQTIDLPLESVVVGGSYDDTNKKIILTLQNGTTIDIPVGDLVAGLQTEITSTNKLNADLVDDSTSTNKFVTSSEKTTWNGKQDAISDLSTIRSNATAGKSASDTIATYGNIVTHNTSEFATSAQGALADTAVQPADLATVATSGSYDDLTDKPTIPAAQVNSDWNAVSGVAQILNKPTIPTVNNSTITITQGGVTKGSFTLNQASGDTIALDAGGGSYTAGTGIDITNDVISVTSAISSGASAGSTALQPADVVAYTAAEVQTIWESI